MPVTASEHRPRRTVRLRLTVLYGLVFLASGAALLVITYLLVQANSAPKLYVNAQTGRTVLPVDPNILKDTVIGKQAIAQRAAMLDSLLTQSGIALALMSAVSMGLGWLMAGRALRPVRTMTDKARQISARNLHERLAITGPDDELKVLGDTIDDLLSRLDAAFDAQRRFVANASHELRTPLTLQRAMIEVALTDPDADAASLRTVCERELATVEHQENLIEALLTLARSERGLDHREPVDLARVAEKVLPAVSDDAVRVSHTLRPATMAGDPRLVERMLSNLVDNAVRHNTSGGWVCVSTGTPAGLPALRVTNSGPEIAADQMATLFQPFQRLEARTGKGDGHGLGLSIVAAIANAHDADLTAVARPSGGLDITITFATPSIAALVGTSLDGVRRAHAG